MFLHLKLRTFIHGQRPNGARRASQCHANKGRMTLDAATFTTGNRLDQSVFAFTVNGSMKLDRRCHKNTLYLDSLFLGIHDHDMIYLAVVNLDGVLFITPTMVLFFTSGCRASVCIFFTIIMNFNCLL